MRALVSLRAEIVPHVLLVSYIALVFSGLEIKPKHIDFSKQRSMRRSNVTTVDCDLQAIRACGTAVETVKDTAE
jgi:hypothetical protein